MCRPALIKCFVFEKKNSEEKEKEKENEGRQRRSHWLVAIDQSHPSIVSNEREIHYFALSVVNIVARVDRFFFQMKSQMNLSVVFVFLLLLRSARSNEEKYEEELYIRPLATGETYLNLLFTTVASPELLQSKSSSSKICLLQRLPKTVLLLLSTQFNIMTCFRNCSPMSFGRRASTNFTFR